MRYIAAQSAVYARTENTALPGSRRFAPRHNISACVSRRMQMSDRDIAAQSNRIIYPPPRKPLLTRKIIQKTPLKSGINQASKRFCAPHNHATPVRTGQHAENAYTPQPTILSIMHRADGMYTQKPCGTFPIFSPSIQKRQHHPGNCQETRSATSPIRHNAL